jgi:hypothetical protein
MVVTNGIGTAYRVHHGLLVGVVELLTEFTTGYWWGRGTANRVHHGLLVRQLFFSLAFFLAKSHRPGIFTCYLHKMIPRIEKRLGHEDETLFCFVRQNMMTPIVP